MQKKDISVALIGYGTSGKVLHAPLIQAVPGLKLTHVVSSDPKKVNQDLPDVRVLRNAEDAFSSPEIDLIVIAAPNDLHFSFAKQALTAGKHVVVDKPFTTTALEASELIALAKAKGLVLSVFQNRRWDSDFLTLKKMISENRFGEILQFESHFDRFKPVPKSRWKEQASRGGGLWADLGSHLVDQVLHLFGVPDSIKLDLEVQRSGGEADDYFHVVFHYQKMRVILHSSSFASCETPRFLVHGTLGSFVKNGLDPQEDQLRAGILPTDHAFGFDDRPGVFTRVNSDGVRVEEQVPGEKGSYVRFYEILRDSIVLGTPPPVMPESALQVIELLQNW